MNKRNGLTFAFLLCFILFSSTSFAQSLDSIKVVARGAEVKHVANNFGFTEGPAVDKSGNIYFTDQPNDNIWKYDTDGKLSLFMHGAGRSNGLYFDHNGNLISCADEHNELWSINMQKKKTVLLTNFRGHLMNGPNDLWIDASGGIYFTDPYYPRDYWTRKNSEIKEQVYYLPKGRKDAVIVDSTIVKPNGIVGTPDGKHLFVADIGDSKIYKYDIGSDGKLLNRRLFAPQGCDGMTLDNQGNLYLAGNGVTIYDAAGNKIGNIPVPSSWSANVCFGGKNRDVLLITASESVYTVKMSVKGVE
ncbi:SMP-30/gluconolactonase/LRE family protein [Danxiaibacter flavus]|uniref:SMP-30/gluconolactonase/LRE family protein n=1 Tax=Danxiaibacter flavus TaxID=3049108 RepID=A0ABV3ZEB0_9BACT|nr:SMP-30/gluconolactonase/LRE family protein [Chitinophagaceae bacterium DXS]